MTSEEVYEMAKETAKANEEGRDIDAVMADLERRISRSALDVETFKDENVKERLGDDYERVVTHVNRIMSFGQKVLEMQSGEDNKTPRTHT